MDIVEYIKSRPRQDQAVIIEFLSSIQGFETVVGEYVAQRPPCAICEYPVMPIEESITPAGDIIHRSCSLKLGESLNEAHPS